MNNNLANININVTSNIAAVSASLTALNNQLNGVRSNNLSINTRGLESSITGLSSIMRTLGSTLQNLGPVGQVVGNSIQTMGNIAQSQASNIGALTSSLLAMNIANRGLGGSFASTWALISPLINNVKDNIVSLASRVPATITLFKYMTGYISGLFTVLRSHGHNVATSLYNSFALSIPLLLRTLAGNNQRAAGEVSTTWQNVGQIISRTFNAMNNSFSNFAIGAGGTAVLGVTGVIIALGALQFIMEQVAQIKLFAKVMEDGIAFNRQLEQITTTYRVLMDERNKTPKQMQEMEASGGLTSKDLVGDMIDFANITPLKTQDLTGVGSTLMQYGVDAKSIMPMLSAIGDVTGGNTDRFKRMGLALSQSFSLGRLQGRDLLQMIDAGFNPLMEIAKERVRQFGGTVEEWMPKLKEEMEDGAIGIDQVIKAFNTATSEGGRFNGMMTDMGQTFDGMLSTLSDKWDLLTGRLSEPMFEALTEGMDNLIAIIDSMATPPFIVETTSIIETYLLPALYEVIDSFLYIFGITPDMDISEAVGKSIKSMSELVGIVLGLAKVLLLIYDIVKIVFQSTVVLVQGLGIIVLVVSGLIEGLIRGIGDAMDWVVIALVGGAAQFKKAYLDAFVSIGEKWNSTVGSLTGATISEESLSKSKSESIQIAKDDVKRVKQSNEAWKGMKDAFSTDNKSFEITGNLVTKMAGQIESTTDTATRIGRTIADLFTTTASGTTEEFLRKLPDKKTYEKPGAIPIPKPVPKDTSKEDAKEAKRLAKELADEAKRAAKELADAWKQVTEAIDGSMKKLVNLGSVFGQLNYEHFSPAKLQARMNRFLKEFTKWGEALKSLSGKIPNSMVAELQGMGMAGFGMTAALAKASPEKQANLVSQFSQMQLKALTPATSTVLFEHTGEIIVKGVTTKNQLVGITNIIAAEIVREKNSNSLTPALVDVFK